MIDARARRRRGRGGRQRRGAEPVDRDVERRPRGSSSSTLRARSSPRPRRRSRPCRATSSRRRQRLAVCTSAPVGSRRSVPVHLPGRRWLTASETLDEESTTFGIRYVVRRPGAGPAHQRRADSPPWRLCPPRQRPARRGHHRPSRGAPGRAPQGGWVQRHPERPQPREQAHARCLRSTRRARHGRDLRHVDAAEERARLRACDSPTGGRRTSRPWSARTSTTRA